MRPPALWERGEWSELSASALALFGSPLHVALEFLNPHVAPALPAGVQRLELVVALPAERVAGLRSWRDDVELWSDDGSRQLVVWEARRWARWWLAGQPRVVELMGGPAEFERIEAWLLELRRAASK